VNSKDDWTDDQHSPGARGSRRSCLPGESQCPTSRLSSVDNEPAVPPVPPRSRMYSEDVDRTPDGLDMSTLMTSGIAQQETTLKWTDSRRFGGGRGDTIDSVDRMLWRGGAAWRDRQLLHDRGRCRPLVLSRPSEASSAPLKGCDDDGAS
jgi:hypothetical protein